MDLVISICITLICSGYLFYYVSMKVHDFTNAIKMEHDHTNSSHRHLVESQQHWRTTLEKSFHNIFENSASEFLRRNIEEKLNNKLLSLQEEVIENYDRLKKETEVSVNENNNNLLLLQEEVNKKNKVFASHQQQLVGLIKINHQYCNEIRNEQETRVKNIESKLAKLETSIPSAISMLQLVGEIKPLSNVRDAVQNLKSL
jgi:hypothetical protein